MIKIRRWQGGGDNSPLIRLLVIRQAIVSGVGAVKVTDWPFWRLPSLQIGMFLITHEMKGCREEMVQNTQLFEYLMKAKKPCQDQTARLHFSQFFPTLIQNLHFFPPTFFFFFQSQLLLCLDLGVTSELASHSRKQMAQSEDLVGGIWGKGLFVRYEQGSGNYREWRRIRRLTLARSWNLL